MTQNNLKEIKTAKITSKGQISIPGATRTIEGFKEDHREGNLMYIDLKEAVYENLMDEIRPVQKKKKELLNNRDEVEQILEEGKEKAKEIASRNMKEVRNMVGVGPT